MEYGVEVGSKIVFPLPMGIERKDRCMVASVGQQWVHATLNTLNLRSARLLEHPNFSAKIGCCDEVWGGGCPKTVFLLPMDMERKGRCMVASV